MRAESLSSFLTGDLESVAFANEINSEVISFDKASVERGTSRPIYLSGELDLLIGSAEVKRICDGFLAGSLTSRHVEYICDAIQMAEGARIESEAIHDLVDALTPSSENCQLTCAMVYDIIGALETGGQGSGGNSSK